MISRYNGTCSFCNKPTKAGQDIYDVESKESYHEDCRENQPPGPADYALAQRLGWLSSDAALHRKWSMFSLSSGTGEPAAGRTELPSRGEQDSLFDVPAGDRSEE